MTPGSHPTAAMAEAVDQARFRILAFSPDLVVTLFRAAQPAADRVIVPGLAGLPTDTFIADATWAWPERMFMVRCYHPTFDPVPAGEAPRPTPGTTYRVVRMVDPDPPA